jgi:hypothetical protein
MAMYILWMEEILHQWFIPLFRGFQASKAVQDFFNPQYGVVMITRIIVHTDPEVCPSPEWRKYQEILYDVKKRNSMFNYVARVLTRTCCSYVSYNQNMLLLHIIWN